MPFALPLLLGVAATCSLDVSIGVPETDALAIQEIVCPEIRTRNDGGEYHLRVTKLGQQVVVRLTSSIGTDRTIMVKDLEEIPVAAPRLVTATTTGSSVGETRDVDNVVGGETRRPKALTSRVHVYFGALGGGTIGASPSAGAMLGVAAGSSRWTFTTDLRLTGDAFTYPLRIVTLGIVHPALDAPSTYASLGAGVRHHFLSSETSPFAGLGLGPTHTGIRSEALTATKTSLGMYAEAGLDFLRTSNIGGAFLLRFDAPAYELGGMWRPFVTGAFAVRL